GDGLDDRAFHRTGDEQDLDTRLGSGLLYFGEIVADEFAQPLLLFPASRYAHAEWRPEAHGIFLVGVDGSRKAKPGSLGGGEKYLEPLGLNNGCAPAHDGT